MVDTQVSAYCLVLIEDRTARADAKKILREHTEFVPLDPYDYVDAATYEAPGVALVEHLIRSADVALLEDRQSLLIGYGTALARGFGIPIVTCGSQINDFWDGIALSRHWVLSDAILNGVAPLGLPTL